MILKLFRKKDAQTPPQKAQPTEELWTEVSTEQQETTQGGYPWPGFPPIGGGGGGFGFGSSSSANARKH